MSVAGLVSMDLPQPLHFGRLIKRYKRFLADVELENGDVITAHCADPGRLPGLAVAGANVWLSHSSDKKRKLAYRLEVIEQAGEKVGLNTLNANKLAREALEAGLVPELGEFAAILPEQRYGTVRADGKKTRFDFAIERKDGSRLWLEIKNVTWRDGSSFAFPDAVTARGRQHMEELTKIAMGGGAAALFFIVQRHDARKLRIAAEIDAAYGRAFAAARAAGVWVGAIACTVDGQHIKARTRIIVDI